MNEFFIALAAICQVHGTNVPGTLVVQRDCQRTIIKCINRNVKDTSRYAWEAAFLKCIED